MKYLFKNSFFCDSAHSDFQMKFGSVGIILVCKQLSTIAFCCLSTIQSWKHHLHDLKKIKDGFWFQLIKQGLTEK